MTTDLMVLVANGDIAFTGAKPKLPTTLPDVTDSMLEVYRIPLKYLYYNDENGRIATQIKREYGDLTPHSDETGADYNDKIAQFIEEDNPTALKKTKKSIKDKSQQVYGYVLQDGRIIDGNRRFTALRQLVDELGTTQYFEAVILPFTYDAKAQRAQIKRLELAIQMGVEDKLQYDPVDLSVDAYNTIIIDELMTVNDYAKESNLKVKDVEDRLATVELIHDFLVFINAPDNAYYLIKDVKLYNPLYELVKKLQKHFQNAGPKYSQTKETAFALLSKMISTGGDTVRELRDYVNNVMDTANNDEYNNQVEDIVEHLRDKLEVEPIKTATDFRKRLDSATPELRELNEIYVTTVNRQNRGKNVDNFIDDVKETLNTLQDMHRGGGLTGNLHFNNFSKDQIEEIRDMLVKINLVSSDLIGVYEDEL